MHLSVNSHICHLGYNIKKRKIKIKLGSIDYILKYKPHTTIFLLVAEVQVPVIQHVIHSCSLSDSRLNVVDHMKYRLMMNSSAFILRCTIYIFVWIILKTSGLWVDGKLHNVKLISITRVT